MAEDLTQGGMFRAVRLPPRALRLRHLLLHPVRAVAGITVRTDHPLTKVIRKGAGHQGPAPFLAFLHNHPLLNQVPSELELARRRCYASSLQMAYIIDGNNVMGQTPGWHRDKPRARLELLKRVAAFARLRGARITIAFDGAPDQEF